MGQLAADREAEADTFAARLTEVPNLHERIEDR